MNKIYSLIKRVSLKTTVMFLAISLLLSFTASVKPASAHVLKTDGSISVQLHIEPDDLPVSNESTGYLLSFRDTNSKFNLSHCDCGLVIQENGQTISQSKVSDLSPLNSTGSYTFLKSDVYTMIVSGKPKSDNSFAPFTISYDIRVEPNPHMPMSTNQPDVILIVSVAGLLAIALAGGSIVIYNSLKKNR